jgi:hypothetical protein
VLQLTNTLATADDDDTTTPYTIHHTHIRTYILPYTMHCVHPPPPYNIHRMPKGAPITKESAASFMASVLAGKEVPYFKSADPVARYTHCTHTLDTHHNRK